MKKREEEEVERLTAGSAEAENGGFGIKAGSTTFQSHFGDTWAGRPGIFASSFFKNSCNHHGAETFLQLL